MKNFAKSLVLVSIMMVLLSQNVFAGSMFEGDFEGEVTYETFKDYKKIVIQAEGVGQYLTLVAAQDGTKPELVLVRTVLMEGQEVPVVTFYAFYDADANLKVNVLQARNGKLRYRQVSEGDDVYNIWGWRLNFTVSFDGIEAMESWNEVKAYLDRLLKS